MKKLSRGFTLVELMIATSLFSVVLMVALTGFFQIGKIYFKGVVTGETQDVAQKITDDMSSALQFASGITPPSTPDGQGRAYMCIGTTRYTFMPNHKLISGNQTSDFGMLRDVVPSCGDPFSGGTTLSNATEMMSPKMRISKLCILSANGAVLNVSGTNCAGGPPPSGCPATNPCLNNLYMVNMTLAYGDDDVLNTTQPTNPTCKGDSSNSQYCAVVTLQTVVNRGYGN